VQEYCSGKKLRMKKVLVIALFLFPFRSLAQADPIQRIEVSIKLEELKKALINKDSILLYKLLADDVVYGHTNGLVQKRNELIYSVMSYEQDYESIESESDGWQFYENTVVVNSKWKVRLKYQGQTLNLNMFVIMVWVKKTWKEKNTDWELVARQSVKLN
jgi:Domain of unknown function (DUF4440)